MKQKSIVLTTITTKFGAKIGEKILLKNSSTGYHEEERGISDKLVFASDWICTPAQIFCAFSLASRASENAQNICADL